MPVERKVSAASVASAVISLILWALSTYVFHTDVPPAVAALVAIVVPGAVTFAVGWLTKHTPRTAEHAAAHAVEGK